MAIHQRPAGGVWSAGVLAPRGLGLSVASGSALKWQLPACCNPRARGAPRTAARAAKPGWWHCLETGQRVGFLMRWPFIPPLQVPLQAGNSRRSGSVTTSFAVVTVVCTHGLKPAQLVSIVSMQSRGVGSCNAAKPRCNGTRLCNYSAFQAGVTHA